MLDIVVADDDGPVLEGLKCRLENAGHHVRTAENGADVMIQVERRLPQLVITDIIMPEQEGIETIIRLRSRYPALKILAISGSDRTGCGGYRGAAADLGADGVLAKPFTTRQLLDAIAAMGLAEAANQA